MQRVAFAHLLRGVAAATVLASHLGCLFWVKPRLVADLILFPDLEALLAGLGRPVVPDFGIPDFWGHFGVGLFFLVSGFVVPFSIATVSRRGFAIARAWRIWPTYAAGLALTLSTLAANAAVFAVPFPYSVREVLFHALIVPRWPTLTRPIDGILWTLEVEVFFYLLCAVCAERLRRFDPRFFVGGLLCVPAAWLAQAVVAREPGSGLRLYALGHWASSMLLFVAFMLIGTVAHFHFRGRIGWAARLALQTGLFIAFTFSWRLGVFAAQGWAGPLGFLAAVAVFEAACAGRGALAALPRRALLPLRVLADVSYPLYVVHGIFGYGLLAHSLRAGLGPWTALGITLAAVLGLAALLHLTVETPSRRFGKALAAKYALRQFSRRTATR